MKERQNNKRLRKPDGALKIGEFFFHPHLLRPSAAISLLVPANDSAALIARIVSPNSVRHRKCRSSKQTIVGVVDINDYIQISISHMYCFISARASINEEDLEGGLIPWTEQKMAL